VYGVGFQEEILMPDKTTKTILALVAAGLWLNAAAALFHSTPASAQESAALQDIARDVRNIAMGVCTNHKLC
jgi:hypothetical protein